MAKGCHETNLIAMGSKFLIGILGSAYFDKPG
jgi:hypothetical protein